MCFLNPTDEERQQPNLTDLLDEDVPLLAEHEPDDPYETAYETDAAGEDHDGGDDCEATQTDETAEVGDGGDVEAQETALVVRKSPHKIRQQSRFATTATSYAVCLLANSVTTITINYMFFHTINTFNV